MSTRCQIGFYRVEPKTNKEISENWEALIYRHCDGYPRNDNGDGIVSDVLPFIKEFKKVRGGIDSEYMSACMLAYFKQWHCGEKWNPKYNTFSVNGVSLNILNHGVSKDIHGDIEFFYAVTPNKLVVYKARCWGEDEFEKIEEIEY